MLSQQDLKQLAQKGISEAQIERQLGELLMLSARRMWRLGRLTKPRARRW